MTNGENSGRYADYDMPDFICDPFFQEWIIHPDGGHAAFWEGWVRQHPEKAQTIDEARLLLLSMSFEEDFPDERMVQQSLAIVREKMDGMERVVTIPQAEGTAYGPEPTSGGRIRRIRWAAAVAAAVVVGTAIGYFLIDERHAQRSYATQYAEIQTLYLPDSSKLILNAHSSVRYNKEWKPGQVREVWLDGEAYFDVRSVAASTFFVHTKDLTVEVLGTAFDIRNRRGKTEVVLQSGKIRVRFPAGGHADIVMTPGNKLHYDPAKAALAHANVIPENYTAWKDKKLTDATAGQIIEYLEDNYNKTIILENETLADKKIGGVILLDNLDDALFALSTVLNVNVIQHQDTLILKPR
jgi:transmembrane sensor